LNNFKTWNYQFDWGSINLFKYGHTSYEKVSFPARCGIYHQVETKQVNFHFNLNHELIRIIGKTADWPHPQEWLKQTVGNDWIYYSTGGYTGVFETTGEFYLPNLPYSTNNHMGGKPHKNRVVSHLLNHWHGMLESQKQIHHGQQKITNFLDRVISWTPDRLAEKAKVLHNTCDGRISVLPPDTRHVDYQVIPLTISQGCLYKCSFCRVKNSKKFKEKSINEIGRQITALQEIYADDLANYNSIFLGQHDALQADPELIIYAIEQAHILLNLSGSYISGSNSFLFGSVASLLKTERQTFDQIEKLPGLKFINIGLGSADQSTLDLLGKPVTASDVISAFSKIQEINSCYATIEISANFVTDEDLPESHYTELLNLVREEVGHVGQKGCIYLSPMQFDQPSRAKLFDFYKLKRLSRLPLFMYTIQRL